MTDIIRVAAALIVDDGGRLLLVRKSGTSVFMQPGGKYEPGETGAQTLARELHEELGRRDRPGRRRSGAAPERLKLCLTTKAPQHVRAAGPCCLRLQVRAQKRAP